MYNQIVYVICLLAGQMANKPSVVVVPPVVTDLVEMPTSSPIPVTENAADLARISCFKADLDGGQIGTSRAHPVDRLYDNVFHFHIPAEHLGQYDIAWLSYRLKGVQSSLAVTKSFNDSRASGGYLINERQEWTLQRERLAPGTLKAGDNVLRIHHPGKEVPMMDITDVQIEIEHVDEKPTEEIILHNERLVYYGDRAHVQGVVAGVVTAQTSVRVNGSPANTDNGIFEAVLDKPEEVKGAWNIRIEADLPNGQTIYRDHVFLPKPPAQHDLFQAPNYSGRQALVLPEVAAQLEIPGAHLAIPPNSLNDVALVQVMNLENRDLAPTPPDLVNVTDGAAGFRFLPDGTQFLNPVGVSLAFDQSRIPSGYTADDVRAFFFDEELRQWIALPADTLLADQSVLISQTTHFTDFIAGVIKVPESPQTAGYVPNAIKNLEAVSPAVGIVDIDAPQPNAMGTANLSFPLKVPAGRRGMQPSLAITYNSEGGNGWLGLGWSLDLPAIEVDTRWGVPRYDPGLESETYTYNGEQLYPVTHRSALKPRVGNEKIFHPRVEGAFQRIIRHGDSPKNYWWEVTDKKGTRNFYGGSPDKGLNLNAVLTDGNGNIAKWMLLETRDLDENFVRYTCEVVADPGIAGSSFMGYQIYPKRITYTGHEQTEGKYSVDFIRDNPDRGRRPDIEIDARHGFKKVTADLLYGIEVRYDGQLVRSYRLDYREGAFFKTLLTAISELDKNGELFYKNEVDYFDEVRTDGEYVPFTDFMDWDSPKDNIKGDIITPINNESTVLGGSKSNSFSAGGALTVGSVFGNPFAKTYTGGGNYNYSSSNSLGLSSLVDISGDGLPDKLYYKNSKIYFRANDGSNGFGAQVEIKGLRNTFEHTTTKSNSVGLEGHPYPGYLGYNQTWSTSTTDAYFIDLNGDGLIDVANDGKGFFNFLNASAQPEFTTQSGLTPSPIFEGSLSDLAPTPPTQEELDSLIDRFPLHDVVRLWQVPFDGEISIDAPARLLGNDAPEVLDYAKNDGVLLSIQHNGAVLWQDEILPDETGEVVPPLNSVSNIAVTQGDRLYFRMQSKNDGAYDQVEWDPGIYYEGKDTSSLDPNLKRCFFYQASEDFLTSSCQIMNLPVAGRVRVTGSFTKPVTSDDVNLQVVRVADGVETLVYDTLFAWDQVANELPMVFERDVEAEESWFFRVVAGTNVDWPAVSWRPFLQYVSTVDGIPTLGLDFCPAVDLTMYNQLYRKAPAWMAADSATYLITPVFDIDTLPLPNPDSAKNKQFEVTFSIKGNNRLYGKVEGQFQNGEMVGLTPLTVDVPAGDSIYFTYHLDDDLVQDDDNDYRLEISVAEILIEKTDTPPGDSTLRFEAGVYHEIPAGDIIFGPLYRGWGHFAYNGNRERADQPIDEDELNASDYEEKEGEEVDFDPTKTNFIILIAEPKNSRWVGLDTLTYVKASQLSSSRFGEDDVSGVTFVQIGDDCKYAPNKISKSITRSGTGGIGPLSASGTWCTTESVTDFMDMNGDRYPDIVFQDRMVLTDQLGGLTQTLRYGLGNHQASSFAVGGGAAGNPGNSNTSNSGNASGAGSNRGSIKAKSKSGRLSYNSKEATESASFVGGVSATVNYDQDRAVHSWMDMNGDGLPDKVYDTGEVALNLGYSFGPKEQWGQEKVRAGESIDIGVGAGVNLFNGSFEAGISSSLSFNSSTGALQDVNGDGLVDYIITEGFVEGKFNDVVSQVGRAFSRGENITDGLVSGLVLPKDEIRVRFNTGNGLRAQAIKWPGVNVMDHGSSVAESANTAITGCIPIPFFGIRICINPNGSLGRGLSRQKTQLTDMNGDGFPDHLESENDGNLRVKLSRIGKTNLVKGIRQSLGAEVEMDFELVGNTPDLPYGKWVLSGTAIHDGLPGDGADVMKYSFEYGDGYFDRHERMFYGFDTVRIHQLDTENEDRVYRTFVNTYHNRDFYRKGLAKTEYLEDGQRNRYTETRYTYQLKDVLTNNDLQPGFERSDSATVFPAMVQSRQLFYEGTPQASLETRMTYEYDALGNVIEQVDFGDGTAGDRLTTQITYHDQPDLYLMSSPASMTITTIDGVIRHKEADIDGAGNPTQIRQYLEDGSVAVTGLEHNAFGLLTKITRPANYKGQSLFYEYTYDNAVQTYITKISDAYGNQSSTSYEYEFGQALEKIDVNGERMVYVIDDRGRVKSMTGPYELAAGIDYTVAYEYYPEAETPYALTKNYDPEHGQDIETYTFVDGLKRPIQVKKTGSIFQGEGQPDQLQMIVSGKVIYDAFGRNTTVYYPTTESTDGATAFSARVDDVSPTRTSYDVLNRMVAKVLPDGAIVNVNHGFGEDSKGYLAFRTTVTDALSNIQETFTDVRGRDRATAEHGPDGVIWTGYRYNALSELLRVIDHHDNETIYAYDHFGRQTSQIHPDGGLATFEYDLADNLLKKTTANIRAITPDGGIQYSYDHERLIGIDYPSNFQNKVQMHYGAPNAPHNRAGRVWLIEDASGGSEYFFGPMGEIIKTIRTIFTSEANVRTFVSESTFDTWNRIQEMIYPDGEVVSYQYNQAGKLQQMWSEKEDRRYPIVDQLGYDEFEQRVFCQYGNGTKAQYTYEPQRRRLQQLAIESPGASRFVDNQYQYDPVGNILELANRAAATGGQLGGTTRHQYSYDKLYRLTTANGNWQGASESAEYQLELAYDNLYNITHKTQSVNSSNEPSGQDSNYDMEYWYDGKQPHTASQIGDRLLRYDGNGNLTSWRDSVSKESWQLLWDEENRLMGVSKDGYLSQYTYDAGGERAVKSHGPMRGVFANGTPLGATTIDHYNNYKAYVSPYFVVDEVNFTKHYYVEGERVLSKIGSGEFNNDFWNFRGVTAGNKNYVQRMQLLQQAYWQHVQQLALPPGEPTVPVQAFPIPGLDSLPVYDNTFPPGWPRPIFPDTTGAPGEPTLVDYEYPDSIYVEAGYGYSAVGASPELNQFFYHPDHLGSANYITDLSGAVRQHTEFMPFGESFVDHHIYTEEQPYLFNGKELDEETGLYYYGARYYDPKMSVWLGVDPKFAHYPGLSPYAFVENNPLAFVDPDGKQSIFVNGMHFGTGGKAEYWSGVDQSLMAATHEDESKAIYMDGALGGGKKRFLKSLFGAGPGNPENRRKAGKKAGRKLAKKLRLEPTESIYIFSHSMGGAFAKGVAEALREKFKNRRIIEADFAPYQPGKQVAVDGVPTLQISNTNDKVASNKLLSPYRTIKGATDESRKAPDKSFLHHGIDNFRDDVPGVGEFMNRNTVRDRSNAVSGEDARPAPHSAIFRRGAISGRRLPVKNK